MSGIYPKWSRHRLCCHATRTNGPCLAQLHCCRDPHQRPSDVGIYSRICNMNVTRVLAARGTGADLSIHRLEPTVTQCPYTVVRTSPCSRDPFITLRRPAILSVPV